ncbi:MAG: hypothetical protein KGL58_09655, partial [Pseudomonadota bacterium]|nr:hypothetical protein [Pseudomonadota bacterium]
VEPVYIQVEVEKGRLQYWQVSQDELHALDEQDLVPGIRIICFTRQDHRFLVDRPLSTQKAKSMAYRELVSLEPVRVVNLSRKYGVVYATHVGRLSRFPARLVPGVACLDMKVGPVKKACAVGIELGSMDGVHLVMVYALKPGVSEAEWVVSINPPHREELYRTWKARHKLQQQTILDAAALIEQAQALPAYPGQPEWNGLDLKQVERAGRWSLAGLSAMMVIWAAASWFELHSALQASQDLGQSIHTEQVRLGALIERYPKVFAWQASLKEDIIFHEAQAVWRPGTTVSIRADLQSVRLRVDLPLIGSRDNRMNRFGIFSVTGLHRLLPVLEESPPEGCDALGMLVSGDMNEIEQDFNCPYRGSSFGALVHG